MNKVYPQGNSYEITLTAGESIAVFTEGVAQVYRKVGYPNVPDTTSLLGEVDSTETVFGAYASGATIIIEPGASPVYYAVGLSPRVVTSKILGRQSTPLTLNATGTLTALMLATRIVTSTTAAAVVATLDTGAVMDASLDMAIGDSFDWHAINTGGANAFTVTAAASGHTVVGAGAVAASTSAHFRTRKTAANTFVTYRLG